LAANKAWSTPQQLRANPLVKNLVTFLTVPDKVVNHNP
jgi:hypothetical protein